MIGAGWVARDRTMRAVVVGAFLAMGALAASGVDRVAAQTGRTRISAPRDGETLPYTSIQLPMNQSKTIKVDFEFSDVLVGASKIAEVIPLSSRSLYILGKEPGTTNITIIDLNKKVLG